jgi:magnesium transporter
LYKKSSWEQKIDIKETIETELNGLFVVSDYIQFNFDRLDDLKENLSNKIDLEQNYIFKVLTVVTVCISLPTLIAGVYGMNFENMPELKTVYGYPLAIVGMIISGILPFVYFRRKKWL